MPVVKYNKRHADTGIKTFQYQYSLTMKKQIYSIRLDPDLHEKAKRQAAREGRTLSNWISNIIKERLPKVSKY